MKAERDDARLLQAEHARLWAQSLGSSKASRGPLATFFVGRNFSYYEYRRRRAEVLRDDGSHGFGGDMVERARHDAGAVRFERLTDNYPPPSDIAFASVCTDKFCPGLEALIASLLDMYPGFACDYWVYHDDGLTEFSRSQLESIYPRFHFVNCDSSRYAAAAAGNSLNQQRIGALGYLTIEALNLSDYRRVVLLDADLLVVGDMSPLWRDPDRNDTRVVADAGALPFSARSPETGRVVFNSGVISLPADALGAERYAQALADLPRMPDVTCEMLRRYADQKFWNVHLADREVTYLPSNYNANKQLLDRFLPEQLPRAAVVHYTSAKPWYTFTSNDLVTDDERQRAESDRSSFPQTFGTWHTTYRRLLGAQRRAAFEASMGPGLDELYRSAQHRGAVLIGNGPSLARTNLDAVSGRVKIAFNWFVNHDDFDAVAVDHLMVMSHMFFGGWHTVSPSFPPGFLDRLRSHRHRPTLWFPFYFREMIEPTPELREFDVRYLLLERPFKDFADQLGYLRTDLRDFLSDAHTGVLTAGLPLALHLGCEDLILVGCDASYGRLDAGDYFYSESRHTSLSTRTSSLHAAWAAGGAAHYCYELGNDAARLAGAQLRDATIGGFLDVVPKVELPGLDRGSTIGRASSSAV